MEKEILNINLERNHENKSNMVDEEKTESYIAVESLDACVASKAN